MFNNGDGVITNFLANYFFFVRIWIRPEILRIADLIKSIQLFCYKYQYQNSFNQLSPVMILWQMELISNYTSSN